MNLRERYPGGEDPFEGDRTLWLRSLPAGAVVTAATITLTPVAPAGAVPFEEAITFADGQGDLGTTKARGTGFVEVDFHARRTLASVQGTGVTGARLQVDMGGTYVEINDRGAIRAPGDTLFSLPADGRLPGLSVTRFRLTATGAPDATSVVVRSVPTNVSVRLGQMPPFWTRLGELTATASSPGFATVLNAFLAEAEVQGGFHVIPFVVHSDTIARLDAEVAIDFVIERSVLPAHLPEVTLPYGFSTLPGGDQALTTVILPREARPVTDHTGAQVRGEFQPTRIALGPIGEEPNTFPVVVSPECALAQPLRSNAELAVTGLDLPLASTQPGLAGLNVAIQADADGKPFGDVLARAEVKVEKPLPAQSAWGSAALPAPFRVLPGVRYWVVLQSQVGQAYWSATSSSSGEPPLQCSRDGGLSWREVTAPGAPRPLAALFRLRHTLERFSVPVQLQIGTGPGAVRRRLDEFAPLGRIDFRFDFAAALQAYLTDPAAAPRCGTGELLTNGGFDLPAPDDATRRLFGFDARASASGGTLTGTVDLSRGVDLSAERVITLSVDGQPALRIDCAGPDPAHTRLGEIIDAINGAVGQDVAFEVPSSGAGPPSGTGHLGLRSLTTGGIVQLLVWRKLEMPAGWEGTPGRIHRIKVPSTDRIIVALEASGTDPVVLAQRVRAVAECTYALLFLYLVASPTSDPGLLAGLAVSEIAPARWEVRWLDAGGAVIRQDQALLARPDQHERVGPSQVDTLLHAPASTAAVELRIVQQPRGVLLLEDASLAPTHEVLENGNFRVRGAEVPQGWSRLTGWVDSAAAGVRLRGDGPESAVLSQTAAMVAGDTYVLQVRARVLGAPPSDIDSLPAQERARLELQWQGASMAVAPAILPLDGREFSTRAWSGDAPAGATAAEVRLIQPQGGVGLVVESVSLRRADLIHVPLLFLAEAPGKLTLSDLRVTYDLPEPPVPQPPTATAVSRVQAIAVNAPRSGDGALVAAVFGVLSLTTIRGIGVARARRLAEHGIVSLKGLASATPEGVARLLRGVSTETAARFIEETKTLLASGRAMKG